MLLSSPASQCAPQLTVTCAPAILHLRHVALPRNGHVDHIKKLPNLGRKPLQVFKTRNGLAEVESADSCAAQRFGGRGQKKTEPRLLKKKKKKKRTERSSAKRRPSDASAGRDAPWRRSTFCVDCGVVEHGERARGAWRRGRGRTRWVRGNRSGTKERASKERAMIVVGALYEKEGGAR